MGNAVMRIISGRGGLSSDCVPEISEAMATLVSTPKVSVAWSIHLSDGCELDYRADAPMEATFTFINVRTDVGTTGAAGASGSSGPAEATVLMTFRGCPEWFVPNVNDPFTACTIPLDAPDSSRVGEWGVGQSFVPFTGLERRYDGAYIFYASWDGEYRLELTGLEPVLRDGFLIYGVDDPEGSLYTTQLDNGETRDIFVFYYYE